MARDLSSDRYQLTADRGLIAAVAKRFNIPLWQAEMAIASDPALLRDVMRDGRHNPATSSRSVFPEDHSQAGKGSPTPQPGGTGWVDPKPLVGSVPGTALIDALYPTTFELEARRKARAEAEAKAKAKEGK